MIGLEVDRFFGDPDDFFRLRPFVHRKLSHQRLFRTGLAVLFREEVLLFYLISRHS